MDEAIRTVSSVGRIHHEKPIDFDIPLEVVKDEATLPLYTI